MKILMRYRGFPVLSIIMVTLRKPNCRQNSRSRIRTRKVAAVVERASTCRALEPNKSFALIIYSEHHVIVSYEKLISRALWAVTEPKSQLASRRASQKDFIPHLTSLTQTPIVNNVYDKFLITFLFLVNNINLYERTVDNITIGAFTCVRYCDFCVLDNRYNNAMSCFIMTVWYQKWLHITR